jgi:hypothetical protein
VTAPYEYLCTQNAHDPEALTRYMNNAADEGWDLFAVTFAIQGESGVHTMFWRRPLRTRRAARNTGAAESARDVTLVDL